MSLDHSLLSKIKEPNDTKLSDSFSFYYRLNEEGLSRDMKPNEFADQVKLICSFDTIRDFWEIFQHIRKPDTCRPGTELFLFAQEIKPLWEDPNNTNGGKVSIRLRKNFSSIIWEEIIFAFIGDIFPESVAKEVTGLVISIRKECNVLQVWFKNYSIDKASILEQSVKEILMIPDGVEVETKPFFKNYFGVSNYMSYDKFDKSDKYEKHNKHEANNEKYPEAVKTKVEEIKINSNGTKTKIVSVDDMFVDNKESINNNNNNNSNNNQTSTKADTQKQASNSNNKDKQGEIKSSILIKNPDYEIEINKIITNDDIQYEIDHDYDYDYSYNNGKAYEGEYYKKSSKRRGKGYYEKSTTSKYREGYYGASTSNTNDEYYGSNRDYDYNSSSYGYGGKYGKKKRGYK